MKFCRIKLSETNYSEMKLGDQWRYITDRNTDQLNDIYKTYCRYKKFDSVMPNYNI